MLNLVTSINEKLYHEYGDRMISGFENYAASDVRLIVVFEGKIPEGLKIQGQRYFVVPLASEEHARFHKFFGHLYEANGLRMRRVLDEHGKPVLKPTWDYKFSAIRFSFKVFALEIARKIIGEGEALAWIDADVKCLKKFSKERLEQYLPHNDEIMSYLGRTSFPVGTPYSECGFLGFNATSPNVDLFLNRMLEIYLSGEIFSLAQWHDSWIWDVTRREFEAKGHTFKDISGSSADLEHPFINCGLGDYFDHLKGPARKKAGSSFASDVPQLLSKAG
jgi:hypothetical protein